MTTTTETSTADRLAELEAAKERLAAANAEREKIDAEYREWDDGIRNAKAESNHLARTEREQFAGGRPRPKTRAAALEKQIADAEKANWREIIRGADEQVAEAEHEARRLTASLAVELALKGYERGLRGRERLLAVLRGKEVRDAIGEMRAAEADLREVAVAVDGPIDGRSVIDPSLEKLERTLEAVASVEPARIPTMTPYPDETVTVVRKNGSWARAEIAGEIDPDQQPPRIERPS